MKHFYLVLLCTLAISSTPSSLNADEACMNQCHADYWACSDNCGPFGGSLCEQQCSDAFANCSHHCQNCPSTRDYTTRTVLSRQYTNRHGCFEDHLYLSGGRRYYEHYTTERHDGYRETTQCDGTKSTQLLWSNNFNYYCWVRGNLGSDACGSPQPNFLPICH